MFVSPISSTFSSHSTSAPRSAERVNPVEPIRPTVPRASDVFAESNRKNEPAAVLNLSDEAKRRAAQAAPGGDEATDSTQPSEEEEKQLRELAQRDREVRVHEQAHKSAGGQYAGAIHFDFQRGPDGKNYAVGGHVNIDVSPIPDDPAATLVKMQQVVRAALAPAEPSPADRSVAAKASGQAAEARQELSEENLASVSGEETESNVTTTMNDYS